jgi:hypothetical protein
LKHKMSTSYYSDILGDHDNKFTEGYIGNIPVSFEFISKPAENVVLKH